MKNFIILIVIIALFGCVKNVNAQMDFGANVGVVLPFRENKASVSFGYGFSLDYRYFLSEKFAVGAHFGYYPLKTGNSSIIPLNASIEYHPNNNGSSTTYFGFAFGMIQSKFDYGNGTENVYSDFAFSPLIGVKYSINDNFQINTNTHFNLILKPDYVGVIELNIGVIYTLNN